MIPINDNVFNNLKWKKVDALKLDKIIAGLTVIGCEPCDYPDTDGITIYLGKPEGDVIAIDIGADYFFKEEGENPFYVSMAAIRRAQILPEKEPDRKAAQ